MHRQALHALMRSWSHRYARLAGWVLMPIGITLGAVAHPLAPLAAFVIVTGFVYSRLWRWETDPIEREARHDRHAARDTSVLRWGEISSGALLLAQLGTLALGQALIAACVSVLVLTAAIVAIRIDAARQR